MEKRAVLKRSHPLALVKEVASLHDVVLTKTNKQSNKQTNKHEQNNTTSLP
jgi:hypothetical protein